MGTAGLVLLAIWLIIQGLKPFVKFSLPSESMLMALLALLAGILIFLGILI